MSFLALAWLPLEIKLQGLKSSHAYLLTLTERVGGESFCDLERMKYLSQQFPTSIALSLLLLHLNNPSPIQISLQLSPIFV